MRQCLLWAGQDADDQGYVGREGEGRGGGPRGGQQENNCTDLC